jgi:hypothetical protein
MTVSPGGDAGTRTRTGRSPSDLKSGDQHAARAREGRLKGVSQSSCVTVARAMHPHLAAVVGMSPTAISGEAICGAAQRFQDGQLDRGLKSRGWGTCVPGWVHAPTPWGRCAVTQPWFRSARGTAEIDFRVLPQDPANGQLVRRPSNWTGRGSVSGAVHAGRRWCVNVISSLLRPSREGERRGPPGRAVGPWC